MTYPNHPKSRQNIWHHHSSQGMVHGRHYRLDPKVPYQAELDLYDFQPSNQFLHKVLRHLKEGVWKGLCLLTFLLAKEHWAYQGA